MPNAAAIFLIVVGFIMGTVFCIGTPYCESAIEKEEAIAVTASYSAYKVNSNRYGSTYVIVRFSDYQQQDINGTCVNDKLLQDLDSLEV
jgi:hypothetical protein